MQIVVAGGPRPKGSPRSCRFFVPVPLGGPRQLDAESRAAMQLPVALNVRCSNAALQGVEEGWRQWLASSTSASIGAKNTSVPLLPSRGNGACVEPERREKRNDRSRFTTHGLLTDGSKTAHPGRPSCQPRRHRLRRSLSRACLRHRPASTVTVVIPCETLWEDSPASNMHLGHESA